MRKRRTDECMTDGGRTDNGTAGTAVQTNNGRTRERDERLNRNETRRERTNVCVMSCVLCVVCCVCVRTWDSSADEQRTNECAGPRQRREGREETRRRGDECAWTRTVTETTTETNAMERTRRKETKEETKQRNVCENGKEDVCARSGGEWQGRVTDSRSVASSPP